MNREQAVREAFCNPLEGQLTYDEVPVPIYDEKMESGERVYVLILDQTAVAQPNMASLIWEVTITFQIVSKQLGSISKDIVDEVSEQLENIVRPNARTNGLQQRPGWQITHPMLTDVLYETDTSNSITAIFKTLTFTQNISKT